jgi:hypothetical protein
VEHSARQFFQLLQAFLRPAARVQSMKLFTHNSIEVLSVAIPRKDFIRNRSENLLQFLLSSQCNRSTETHFYSSSLIFRRAANRAGRYGRYCDKTNSRRLGFPPRQEKLHGRAAKKHSVSLATDDSYQASVCVTSQRVDAAS